MCAGSAWPEKCTRNHLFAVQAAHGHFETVITIHLSLNFNISIYHSANH